MLSDATDRPAVPTPACPSWCDGSTHGVEPIQLHSANLGTVQDTDQTDRLTVWLEQYDDDPHPSVTLDINGAEHENWLILSTRQAQQLADLLRPPASPYTEGTKAIVTEKIPDPGPQCPDWCEEQGDHGVDREYPADAFYHHRRSLRDGDIVAALVQPWRGPLEMVVNVSVSEELTPAEARVLARQLLEVADMVEGGVES